MRTSKLSLAAAALLALTACSRFGMAGKEPAPQSAAEKQAKAQQELCRDMTKHQEAVREYPSVDSLTPLQIIVQANEKIDKAAREVSKFADDIDNPGVLEVQAANQRLQSDATSVPGGRETVGPTADSLEVDVQDLRSAWDKLYSSLQCGA
jgi:hypothetical protein